MARILFVDDNADFARTSSAVLHSAGHVVVLAENGALALQRTDLHTFDLVISDILMPEKEGFETIITLRRQLPNVAIIAISGGGIIAAREYLRSAAAFGANLALEKPFSGLELMLAVNKALRPPPTPVTP